MTAPTPYAVTTPDEWAAMGRALAEDHVRDRTAYVEGRTDEPDPLAPARGVLVGLLLGAPFAVGPTWHLTGVGNYLAGAL